MAAIQWVMRSNITAENGWTNNPKSHPCEITKKPFRSQITVKTTADNKIFAIPEWSESISPDLHNNDNLTRLLFSWNIRGTTFKVKQTFGRAFYYTFRKFYRDKSTE